MADIKWFAGIGAPGADELGWAPITSSAGGLFSKLTNRVTISSAQSSVNHGIGNLRRTDPLLVYANSTFLQEGKEYTVSEDGQSITKTSGAWDKDTVFDFVAIVITMVPDTDVLTMAQLENIEIVSEGQSSIPIGIPSYDPNHDILEVYHKGIRIYKGLHYTANSSHVLLTGYEAEEGDEFLFTVKKKIRDTFPEGIVTYEQLDSNVKEKLDKIEDLEESKLPISGGDLTGPISLPYLMVKGQSPIIDLSRDGRDEFYRMFPRTQGDGISIRKMKPSGDFDKEIAKITEDGLFHYKGSSEVNKAMMMKEDNGLLLIPQETDLNNFTDTGFYNGSHLINAPLPSSIIWWYVEILRHTNPSTDFVLQRATVLSGRDDMFNRTFVRTRNAGSWTEWELLGYAIPDIGGPSFDLNNITEAGQYHIEVTNKVNGPPDSNNGILTVRRIREHPEYVTQTYHTWHNRIYVRSRDHNGWKSWEELLNKSGGVLGGNLVVRKSGDAYLEIDSSSIPETEYRVKRIYSTTNDGYQGNSIMFRQQRPDNGRYIDFKLAPTGQEDPAGNHTHTVWHTGNIRITNGKLTYRVGTEWKEVGGGVKEVQRGVVTTNGSGNDITVSISNIDPNKSFVNIQGSFNKRHQSGYNYHNPVYVKNISSTSIVFAVHETGSYNAMSFSWEIVEYN